MNSDQFWNKKKSIQLFDDGVALELENHTEKAIELYQESVALWPENSKAQYSLGLALATIGKIDQAIRAWKRAVWLNSCLKSEISNALQLCDSDESEIILFEHYEEVKSKAA